ncbi:MAG: hypothetical protein QUV35_05850 [Hydrogenophaga sp.]|uniref:hypothetical protein n=1 Tax=Hydrogenophaga sp. TaxID=1904254 RepID=UPI0026096C8D|nr:hypothetical protein [Hydrogenophaga sp.]MDM7942135.1 hypothetical protein [Hydrogenophaga sp.]
MTERDAPARQPGPGGPRLQTQPQAASAHQPMPLAAVLRHLLTLDGEIGSAGLHGALMANDPPTQRRINDHLAAALDTCLQLDTARLQLQNAFCTQRELQTVLEMLVARADAGQAGSLEVLRVSALLAAGDDKVFEAMTEWRQVGQRFTRQTRLLPAQLEPLVDAPGPIAEDEMDRLAKACLWVHAGPHPGLQRAGDRSEQRTGASQVCGQALDAMVQARIQAVADFSAAREAYLQTVLDLDRQHARYVRARSLRRTAEAAFRFGSRCAIDLSEAIVEERQCLHVVLERQARRMAATHWLYALAGCLPRRFGWVQPPAWH